jgi:hypothetical protein
MAQQKNHHTQDARHPEGTQDEYVQSSKLTLKRFI